jgi:hypothetical protein
MRRGYPTGVTQVNQWLNPLKLQTDSNLVDVGRAATHAVGPLWADGDSKVGFVRRPRGHEEGLRRTRDEVAGEKLGANPRDNRKVRSQFEDSEECSEAPCTRSECGCDVGRPVDS